MAKPTTTERINRLQDEIAGLKATISDLADAVAAAARAPEAHEATDKQPEPDPNQMPLPLDPEPRVTPPSTAPPHQPYPYPYPPPYPAIPPAPKDTSIIELYRLISEESRSRVRDLESRLDSLLSSAPQQALTVDGVLGLLDDPRIAGLVKHLSGSAGGTASEVAEAVKGVLQSLPSKHRPALAVAEESN